MGLYQEILFQIWRGLPNLREPGYANTWVYRVALERRHRKLPPHDRKIHDCAVAIEPGQLVEWSDLRQTGDATREQQPASTHSMTRSQSSMFTSRAL